MLINRGTADNSIFMWDESVDKFTMGLTTADGSATGNITLNSLGTLVANIEGAVTGTVSSLSNHDTDDLAEGSSLYYTDARSRSAISATGDISYNSSTGVISFTQATAPVTSVNTQTGAVVLDTDDIGEGSTNIYFTNARADTRINLQTGANLDLSSKSTSDLSEGSNFYYTDARVQAVSINNVVEDTTPQLGGDLDLNSSDITGTGDINITGTIQSSGNITGTLATAAQPNITSVGTLTGLTTTGNLVIGTEDNNAAIIEISGGATGSAEGGEIRLDTAADYDSTYEFYRLDVSQDDFRIGRQGQTDFTLFSDGTAQFFGNLAATLSTAAQPNVTSVGTLSGLTVSGDLLIDTNTLFVDASEDVVGINTTSNLNQTLNVLGTSSDTIDETTGVVKFEATGGNGLLFGTQASSPYRSYIQSAYTIDTSLAQYDLLLNPLGGKVGIGTTSPSGKLHVEGATSGANFIIDDGSGYGVYVAAQNAFNFNYGRNETSDGYINFRGYQDGNTQFRNLHIGNGKQSTIATFDGVNSRVGIGTTSPQANLHINPATANEIAIAINGTQSYSTGEYQRISAGDNYSLNRLAIGFGYDNPARWSIKYSAYHQHIFSTGNDWGNAANIERMRIDSSGSLHIGTTSEATGSTGGVSFSADSNNRRNLICATTSTGTQELIEFRNPNGTVGTIKTSGSSTSYNTSSDYRLKENVDYEFNALDRVAQLKPARFNFKADADTTVDGFLAHEVQDIIPEAITGEKDAVKEEEYEITPAVLDDDGETLITEAEMGTREVPSYQSIDQSKLVPLLTKAIQEQQELINNLTSRIEELEN